MAAFSLQDVIRWESQPGKIGRRCPVGRESQEVQYPSIREYTLNSTGGPYYEFRYIP